MVVWRDKVWAFGEPAHLAAPDHRMLTIYSGQGIELASCPKNVDENNNTNCCNDFYDCLFAVRSKVYSH